jgi:hypothetical protein
MSSRHVKRGVKREHDIIEGVLPMLEEIAALEGVRKVVPAGISYSPRRRIRGPTIKFQRETISGFKLLAQSKGCIQEIFVVVDESKREEVKRKLEDASWSKKV